MAQLRLGPELLSLLHLPLGGLSAASTSMKRSAQLVPRQSASRHPPMAQPVFSNEREARLNK